MNLDLSKLSAAPWIFGGCVNEFSPNEYDREGSIIGPSYLPIPDTVAFEPTDAKFICLARAAFDVMKRRQKFFHGECCSKVFWNMWYEAVDQQWHIQFRGIGYAPIINADDPFTLLVEADKWYVANIEGRKQ